MCCTFCTQSEPTFPRTLGSICYLTFLQNKGTNGKLGLLFSSVFQDSVFCSVLVSESVNENMKPLQVLLKEQCESK